MTARRSRSVLVSACLLLAAVASSRLVAAPPQAVGPALRPGPLGVHAAAWIFPSRPLAVTLEQRGVLAGRRLAIDLFIDGNQLERVATRSDRSAIRMATPDLAPGRHVLMARAGRESAQTEFRVLPWSWLVAAGAGLLLALAATGFGVARARRRRPGCA